MSVVALVACPSYEPEIVRRAVTEGFALLGGDGIPGGWRGKRALLKPNLLRPASPEKGVTTHPSVFSAVARHLQGEGAELWFGDSPNGIFSQRAAAESCGLAAEADALGIPMGDFNDAVEARPASVGGVRTMPIARCATECDLLVNLPRLKTHNLTTMTGALKNTFGLVPGMRKAEYHVIHPDVEGFCRMIVDVNRIAPPGLVVMDAIEAMEGNGPSSGPLVHVGLLALSTDPVAVDAIGCRIMGLDPAGVMLVRLAEEAGLGNASAQRIEMRGARLEDFIPKSFALPPANLALRIPKGIYNLAKDLIVPKPVIARERCRMCGECVRACPPVPKALSIRTGEVPRFQYALCIRCWCCLETCPHGAISAAPAPLGGLFGHRR